MIDYNEKWLVSNAMMRWGGSFVQALGTALMKADADNTQRIKDSFPEYWKRYLEIGIKKEEELKK